MHERVMMRRVAPPAVHRRERPAVRRRLTVGPADDSYEREADVVAAKVLANLARPPALLEAAEGVQRRTATGAEGTVAADGPVGAAGGVVPPAAASRIRPNGDQFDGVTRERMESAFGADFSDVRVHTSATIDSAADDLQADAFTLGRDVYVRRALYQPGTRAGDGLLAHELTHTLQQGGSRIRRSTGARIDVRADMPADRISRKKQMLYLDFVKMKRYDPKFGRMLKKKLGMDVGPDVPGGSYGHWWTEIGKRDPDSGVFKHDKSYGWWPTNGASPTGALMGVPGSLNQGAAQDGHAGETGKAGLTEFHPAMNVDTAAETYDQIKTRVSNGIDNFSRGYSGVWQWKLGWGQNCHTFQQDMKTTVKMHYQSAKGWLEDPAIKAEKATKAKEASDNLAAVKGGKWHHYTQDTMSSLDKRGEDVDALRLDDSREFTLTGAKAKRGDQWCQECVTRLGDRGFVPEIELRQYSDI